MACSSQHRHPDLMCFMVRVQIIFPATVVRDFPAPTGYVQSPVENPDHFLLSSLPDYEEYPVTAFQVQNSLENAGSFLRMRNNLKF